MEADLIIKSNAIFNSIDDDPFSGFVAIKGNKIIGVEKKTDVNEFKGTKTQIIDVNDYLVMPGFHDSHTHLLFAGMYKASVNMGVAKTEEEAVKMVYDFEKAHPSEGWIFGFNWYHVFWNNKTLPTKASLDKYFPDRPVFLVNAEAHGAWVNSKALELAGVNKDTPNPFGGEIAKFPDGEPTGFLYEGAIAYVGSICFNISLEKQSYYLKSFCDTAAPLGITSVVDVQPYFGANMGSAKIYQDLADKGELTVRVHVASNLFGDLDQAAEDAKTFTGGLVRANLVKQFVDGVFTTHTALMLEDYADEPGNKGIQLCELDKIEDAVNKAHKLGLSIKIHAIGDRGIRFTLDAFEKAIKWHGKNKARHAIEHLELVDDKDMPRLKDLGIIPSIQPEHVGLMPTWEGEEYRYVLGEERAAKTWKFKTMLKTCGVIACGSDCPVVDNNPFLGVHRGMTRLHDDGLPEGGWNPSEKLTLPELLKGYTIGSAYGVSREDELGTLEVGKLADIVVVDRNLFTSSPMEIRNAKIDLTIFNGKIIFDKNRVI